MAVLKITTQHLDYSLDLKQTMLEELGITDKASYRRWCRENHPDKNKDDPEATKRFQEVSAEWRRVHEPQLSEAEFMASLNDYLRKMEEEEQAKADALGPGKCFVCRETEGDLRPLGCECGRRAHRSCAIKDCLDQPNSAKLEAWTWCSWCHRRYKGSLASELVKEYHDRIKGLKEVDGAFHMLIKSIMKEREKGNMDEAISKAKEGAKAMADIHGGDANLHTLGLYHELGKMYSSKRDPQRTIDYARQIVRLVDECDKDTWPQEQIELMRTKGNELLMFGMLNVPGSDVLPVARDLQVGVNSAHLNALIVEAVFGDDRVATINKINKLHGMAKNQLGRVDPLTRRLLLASRVIKPESTVSEIMRGVPIKM